MLTKIYNVFSNMFAGFPVGLLVGMQVSGVLCKDLGWEYTFYVFGKTVVDLCLPLFSTR